VLIYPSNTFVESTIFGLILLLSLFLTLGLNWGGTTLDEAFHLVAILAQIIKGVIYVVNYHVDHVTGREGVGLQIGSINCRLDVLFLASSS
jgi:hypothetical protein